MGVSGQQRADPREVYRQRLDARRAEVGRQTRREARAGAARVAAFLAVVLCGWAAARGGLGAGWLWAAIAAFVVAVAVHRRVVARLRRAERAVDYYFQGLARLDDRWSGVGPEGLRFLDPAHPYAADLDLFGRGSLFQLLSSARTPLGHATLARWLLAPAAAEVIRARQQAVEELRDEIDLREELALFDARTAGELDADELRAWAAGRTRLADWFRPALAVVLGASAAAALVGWGAWDWPLSVLVAVLLAEGALVGTMLRDFRALGRNIDLTLKNLDLLAGVLRILEAQTPRCELLRRVLAPLAEPGARPSRAIARLTRLAEWFETMRHNQFVAPIAFAFLLLVHGAYALERWRRRHAADIPRWLDAVGEYEALLSLSRYAFEHPDYPAAELADDGPLLEAEGLGHPLIPAPRRVANDVRLGCPARLWLVSGSNMSGKSTLLRSVGCNVVLALAGSPVCAARLVVSPLRVGSAMRVQDSLQEGESRFFAEIKRLRAIVAMAEAGGDPVLFLLDEILHGTNSHDRRIGAEGVVRRFVELGAMGLVTTHDLALSAIAEQLGPRAANVHFEDQFQDGRMTFDYRLRPGVVPGSNALALMRLLGLEVG